MNVKLRNNLWGYFFIGPFVIGFFAFTIIPIITSLYLSFTQYNLFSPPEWVGFSNFKKMFTDDPRYFQSLTVIFIYVFGGVPARLGFVLIVDMFFYNTLSSIGIYCTMYCLSSMFG